MMILTSKGLGMKQLNPICKRKKWFSESTKYPVNTQLTFVSLEINHVRRELHYAGFVWD